MENHYTMNFGKVIEINEPEVQNDLRELVHSTLEEILNAMLDAEAEAPCNALRYERSETRTDTRAGFYERDLYTGLEK